jgi:cell fate regulator YaaT (PSP1 superfamily)
VGVRFKDAGKVYYFDARGIHLDVGNYVVVDTSHGQEVGRVVISPDQVIASEIKESLKPILRVASPEDVERAAELRKRAAEQLIQARRAAAAEMPEMHIVTGDYALDGSQVTFYFTADDKVDFRPLARSLSTEMNVRVQFLQIGDRDRAKMVDGIGRCGERLCCSSWLGTFPTVSIRMAKEQDLPLNPSKLSGACGRLLCCLTYEFDQYREIKAGLPKVGARISTPTGEAKVLKINVPRESITLFIDGSSAPVDMPLTQFRLMYGTALRPSELVESFEKQLMDAEKPVASELPPPRARPRGTVEEIPAPREQQPGQPPRRRRRRGGRRRGGRGGRGAGGPPPPA